MKVKDISKILDVKIYSEGDLDRDIKSVYVGDLLSHVMSKIESDALWITIMNNVNVSAVASLSDTSLILLCEGVEPDETLVSKAKEEKINLMNTQYTAYEIIEKIIKNG